jgi:Ca-activated chloride channel family protein
MLLLDLTAALRILLCMILRALFICLFLAQPAHACRTALILAMDVSQSVDPGEFRLQIDGLAAALRDPEIAEILVRDQVALSVLQWSGVDAQEVSLDWTRMLSPTHVQVFANAVQRLERGFVMSNTAPAEAMQRALQHFKNGPECDRRVVDMSGDGTPNAGGEVGRIRRTAERSGITVNGLAIESLGRAITNFYLRSVITSDGFVETARGFRDYARAIRRKILREISTVTG